MFRALFLYMWDVVRIDLNVRWCTVAIKWLAGGIDTVTLDYLQVRLARCVSTMTIFWSQDLEFYVDDPSTCGNVM